MDFQSYQALQQVMELGDRFLSYVDEGTGPPVVLVHGIPTWGYLWHPLLGQLAPQHRVLIPDLLGYGASDRRDCFDRSVVRQAEALAAWMDALDLDEATVVGHDIGGAVALRLALAHPERVARLGLVDAVAYDSWPILGMLQLGHPAMHRLVSARALRWLLRQLMRLGCTRPLRDELLDGLTAPYATEVGKLSLIRDAAALDTSHTQELTPELRRLHLPTLVLWGEADPFQPVRFGERLAWDIPGATLRRVAQAGHYVMLDRPREVGDALRELLSRPAVRPVQPGAAVPGLDWGRS